MDPDAAKTERLKKMQMVRIIFMAMQCLLTDLVSKQADLGTAHRDFISARDDKKNIPRVRIEELEAARESNIRGTAAQQQAQKDKHLLTQWTSKFQ